MNKIAKGTVLCAAALAVLSVTAGRTMSFFTATDTKTNVFTLGDLDIGLNEPEWDPAPEDGKTPDGTDMYPGYTVYKNPTVKNITSGKNGNEPCYMRVKVHIVDHDDGPVTDEETLELIRQMIYYDDSYNGTYTEKGTAEQLVEGRIPGYCLEELAAFPTVNPVFELDEERSVPSALVYAYTGPDGDGILDSGEEAVLFSTVAVPTDWTQRELSGIGDFKLVITAEAVQCSGFESREDAYEALDTEIASGNLQEITEGSDD